MFGADIAQIRETSGMVLAGAVELQEVTARLNTQVEGAQSWQGADADRFRVEWSNTSVPLLTRSIEFLKETGDSLVLHANEQEDASAVDGVGGSIGDAGSLSGNDGIGKVIRMAAALAAALARALGQGGEPVEVPADMTPKETAEWWEGLSEKQRQDLIKDHPDLIGNLDGLPASVRDEANRARLITERDRLEAELEGATGERKTQIEESLKAIGAIEKTLADERIDAPLQLLLLDIDNGKQPNAAIGLGDVDSADHVAVLTPGISTTVGKDINGAVVDAMNLNNASTRMLDQNKRGETSSTIVWFGYDFPPAAGASRDALRIITPDTAMEGGRSLASFGEGLKASHEDNGLHLTALGHSYGSTTTGYALQYTDAFDTVGFFGSPGIGTSNIGNLHVSRDQVFVLEAREDFVADAGIFGGDPNHLRGVNQLNTGKSDFGSAVTGHSDYLTDKSTSQHNMAAILTGNNDLAVTGGNSDVGDSLLGGIFANTRAISSVVEGAVRGASDGGIGGAIQGGLEGAVDGVYGTISAGVNSGIDTLKDVGGTFLDWVTGNGDK